MFITFKKTFILQTNINIMSGKWFRPGADSDSSESWNFLVSMVESQSQLFGIELELCWVEFWIVMVYDSDSTHLCSSNSGVN